MKTRKLIISLLLMVCTAGAAAQEEEDPCPGFRNPTSFNTGSDEYFWTARVGERVSTNNVNDTTTGYYVMSTCAASNCTDIIGHNNIVSSSYNSGTDGGISCCSHEKIWDANDRRFQIINSTNAGLDQFTVNAQGTGMQRIPTGYTSCIRLGDPRATGSASASHTWKSGSNRGAEALFYTMFVTPQNALLFVYYAVVARCFDHQPYQAGEFLIRVVKQDDEGNWESTPINDSLWFKVSAPKIPAGKPIEPWVSGKPGQSCGSTTCAYVYKPWTKVAINLNQFLYKNVRIEIYTSDCIYNVDPIYAYICGDYQPMAIAASGCPSPESDVLDTLSAPEGMISYAWYVTENGAVSDQDLYDYNYLDTVSFRKVFPLDGDTTYNRYSPRLEDFVTKSGDTTSKQTFMCLMYSALDPNKPFASKLYANVENRKPMLNMDYETECDGSITFHNRSYSYTAAGLDDDSTYWVVYADSTGLQPLDTLLGDNPSYRYTQEGYHSVRLYCTNKADGDHSSCSSAKLYTVRSKYTIPASFTVNKEELCETDVLQTIASDSIKATASNLTLQWTIDGDPFGSGQVEEHTTLPAGPHTIGLTVSNADSCSSSCTHTVMVYGQPTIGLGSDISAICPGESVTLTAMGSVECNWVSTPHDPLLDSVGHAYSITVSPTQTTVYSLLPPTNTPCIVNRVDVEVEVVPYPTPTIRASSDRVNKEDSELTLQDISPYSHSSRWSFSDGSVLEGQRVQHSFADLDADSVSVSLHTCNRLDCCSDTTVYFPVEVTAVWFPNAFTPDQENNNTFGIITTLHLIDYELYIYNRNGQLIWQSTDQNTRWDGTSFDGKAMPQGTYAYQYRYAYSPDSYHSGHGSITLIR